MSTGLLGLSQFALLSTVSHGLGKALGMSYYRRFCLHRVSEDSAHTAYSGKRSIRYTPAVILFVYAGK